MKFISTSLLSILLLTFSACGSSDQSNELTTDQSVVKVRVEKAVPFKESIAVSGLIKATNRRTISTRLMGHLTQYKVDLGQRVKKGTLLVEIYSEDLIAKRAQVEAGIQMAQATFENAKHDYERYQSLLESESVSEKEFENMKTRFEIAKAGLEQAKQQKAEVQAHLDYAQIKAPFDGVITNKHLTEGTMVTPGVPLMEFEAEGAYELWTSVPGAFVNKLTIGQELTVMVDAVDLQTIGFVKEIATSSINTAGQYSVRIAIDKTSKKLLSGMYARVYIADSESTSVAIQNTALVQKGQLKGVYTISDQGTSVLRWLKLGRQDEDRVEVLSGIHLGEEYILDSEAKIENGTLVSFQ